MKPDKYNWLGLYRDPDDARLIVPKRVPAMGWTINIGHRYGTISLIVVALMVAAAIGWAAFH